MQVVATLRHHLPEDAWIQQDGWRWVVDCGWNIAIAIVAGLELQRHTCLGPTVEDRSIRAAARHKPDDARTATVAIRPIAFRAIWLLLQRRHAATVVVTHQAISADWHTLAVIGFSALRAACARRRHTAAIGITHLTVIANGNTLAVVSFRALRTARMGRRTDTITIAQRALGAWHRLTLTAQVWISPIWASWRNAIAVIVAQCSFFASRYAAAIQIVKALGA